MTHESEASYLVKSKLNSLRNNPQMPYTDGIYASTDALDNPTASSQPDEQPPINVLSANGSQHSQISDSEELIEFNNDSIISQFHFDAIKQVNTIKQ